MTEQPPVRGLPATLSTDPVRRYGDDGSITTWLKLDHDRRDTPTVARATGHLAEHLADTCTAGTALLVNAEPTPDVRNGQPRTILTVTHAAVDLAHANCLVLRRTPDGPAPAVQPYALTTDLRVVPAASVDNDNPYALL